MEVIINIYIKLIRRAYLILFLFIGALCLSGFVQLPGYKVSIEDGKVILSISRRITDKEIKELESKYELDGLPFKSWLNGTTAQECLKYGWNLESEKEDWLVLSRTVESIGDLSVVEKKLLLAKGHESGEDLFPLGVFRNEFGFNSVRQYSAVVTTGKGATLFLEGYKNAADVRIAGSFTQWEKNALPMKSSAEGWYIDLTIAPGKYFYKFLVDGNWVLHKDNLNKENDGKGNINSVLYVPNHVFRLDGFQKASRVFVAGSFNGWSSSNAAMRKINHSWELPVFLPEGTQTYRFVADGKWMEDPANKNKLRNEYGEFNSCVSIGKPYVFRLDGFQNAKQVILVGSFNGWRDHELFLEPRNNGWEITYVPGSGNHEYYYLVDGFRVGRKPSDAEPVKSSEPLNFQEVVGGNYTFILKGYKNAKCVYLSGSFNNWSESGFPMKRVNDEWQMKMYLPAGKQTYKFIVDGKWIIDPTNKLWEGNEHHTKNSVLWFGVD
ncbi:MAG: hypothetical protein MUE99_08695 [Chitinophagaceae bacterium]|nr:hypothetical protein [Chitinophagaceae bacterium]